ncbi:hypothetical protein Bpfe_021488 [Biomphalaria pfeifferi]|uniref:Uncharacterized protein n=1 Tax=Biomphalaria pfeifferi TaxID=112525 RepID=A0AAD8B6Q6_BIOPF|nr:hypothetical protein Bpfe_021488 [Biomphalaria pfeifferi]
MNQSVPNPPQPPHSRQSAANLSRSPVTPRAQSRPYAEYVAQQQRVLASCRSGHNKDLPDGPRLWRQMMIGFTCAGFVGLTMLVLGTVFIAEAVGKQQPITVMLCVMGIVFGIIILVGTIILGRLLISRKWLRCQGRETMPASQCFHTCSVIYSPSLDQLGASETMLEAPPAYESVISIVLHPLHSHSAPAYVEHPVDEDDPTSIMVLPPKYDEVNMPLPEYYEKRDV